MLTIKNITKAWGMDVSSWRIGKVETLNSTYLFHLYKLNSNERLQVNLERSGINTKSNKEYEMWYWKGMSNNPNNALPERLLFTTEQLNTMDKFFNAMNLLLM